MRKIRMVGICLLSAAAVLLAAGCGGTAEPGRNMAQFSDMPESIQDGGDFSDMPEAVSDGGKLSGMRNVISAKEVLSDMPEAVSDREVLSGMPEAVSDGEVLSGTREAASAEEALSDMQEAVSDEEVLSGMPESVRNRGDIRNEKCRKVQYLCTKVEDGYEVILYNRLGEAVFSEVFPREPGIRRVAEHVLEISVSVGSPAVYVHYFNTESLKISETYFNPILVGDRYVAYMEDQEELIIKDIFHEDLPEMSIAREFSRTANPISAVLQIKMIDDETILLTYLQGTDYAEVSEKITLEIQQAGDVKPEEWRQAYLDHLEAAGKYARNWTYSLVYVDEDDIPELWIDTGYEAGGCSILTFHDHVLDEWFSNRLNVTYIERENLVCNSDGVYGYYFDDIYSIQDGKWVHRDGGKYGDGPDGVQFDERGEWICFYSWAGEDVSGAEYEARLNAVYPSDKSERPDSYYTLDEICSILRTESAAGLGSAEDSGAGNVSAAEKDSPAENGSATAESLRRLAAFLEGNSLPGVPFQETEKALCYFGAGAEDSGGYMIRVYRETVDRDICLACTLQIDAEEGTIYRLESDSYWLIMPHALEGFVLSGEPEGFWEYEEGSIEDDRSGAVLAAVSDFLREEQGMEEFKLIYEGIYDAWDRSFHHVSLTEENQCQVFRARTYCVDVESSRLYEQRLNVTTGTMMELHYLGEVICCEL